MQWIMPLHPRGPFNLHGKKKPPLKRAADRNSTSLGWLICKLIFVPISGFSLHERGSSVDNDNMTGGSKV